MLKERKIDKHITTIAIDAEWCGKSFLSVQLALSNKYGRIDGYYVFSDDEKSLSKCPSSYKNVEVTKVYYPIGKKGILDYFEELPKVLECMFFYSPRDIESLLGCECWTGLLVGGQVDKRRNLNIKPYKLEFHDCRLYFIDLFGRFGCSLENAYKSVGIDTSNGKDYINLLNVDKGRMDLFRNEHPQEFYEYALGDLELHKLANNLRALMSDVLEDCFGLMNVYESVKSYPSTVGNLVNDIFLRFLEKEFPGLLRSSILFSMTPNNKAAEALKKHLDRVISGKCAYKISRLIARDKRLVHGLGMCSIPAFFAGHYGLNDTSPLGAVVQGGRAIKEEPSDYLFRDVLDIDLQSAYGSSLTRFDYPIGIPTIVSNPNHCDKRITLKAFLKKYKEELVDGLYVIYVSGNLDHKQDLVYSKYELNSSSVGGRILTGHYDAEEEGEARLGGRFVMTSKQIELGIITSGVLEAIEKVSNTREYKGWMGLKVDLAVYYPKSLEIPVGKWIEAHNHPDKLGELSPQSDNRSRYWCRFSLNSFVGRLLDKRLEYKSKRHESLAFECKQALLKLIINTLYGDLASPFFTIGNTVVANNITASVRVGSWLMSKALGCKFIVTDGGIYTPLNVPTLKSGLSSFRKAGFEKLVDRDNNWSAFVDKKPLISTISTPEKLKNIVVKGNAQELLDQEALEHIQRFCDLYGINFKFKVEHKLCNSGLLAVTNPYGKVDYIIYTYDGKEVIKVRGVQPKDYKVHPKVEFLRALAENREVTFFGGLLSQLVGINDYISNPSKYGNDLPGHELLVEYVHKPNKDGGNIFEFYSTFLKAEEAHKKRVSRYESKYKDVDIRLKPTFLK